MAENVGITERELIKQREEKLEQIKSLGINPYPSFSGRRDEISSIIEHKDELMSLGKQVAIAGRLMALRGHGQIIFADLTDESGKIQVFFRADRLNAKCWQLIKLLDLGDFVFVQGALFVTNAGELTVEAIEVELLTKSLHPLPSQWYGLKDDEIRLRKRYLEFLLDPKVREMFYQKAKFWQATRNFLVERGFLEVETPVLESTTGGADANPFQTHHEALDIDVFLRISAGELWQKRLMVAGFEKTFEIGRIFRNEGISREHLQDYSQMEYYWAYANYEDSMRLVEELYQYLAKETFGTTKFTISQFEVDLSGEWPKIDYAETIKEKTGLDIFTASRDEVIAKIKELGGDYQPADEKGRLIDCLWKQIRKTIAGPVFLVNHPVEVSPLAKRMAGDPRKVERFQPIIAGSEMGNGYTELNDPIDQAERFKKQAEMRAAGDKEAQMNDQDFVESLEYGMPPTTGFGFSERLFAFLANKPTREAVIFPLMRPQERNQNA